MILIIKKIFLNYLFINFKQNRNISFIDLNFRKIDFTNYTQIKLFIFKKNFYKIKNKHVQNFDFLNFSNKLGGKIGLNLSKESIFSWYKVNKYKMNYPWSEDLASRRFINLIYNFEYINSSSNFEENKKLRSIIQFHMHRVIFDFNQKKIGEISSYDMLAFLLSSFLLKKINQKKIEYIKFIVNSQIDRLGVHKSYNLLEHSKFINNLNEIKNVLLFFKQTEVTDINQIILKMTSILNEYFHHDGSITLFNGSNNNYTETIRDSLNKDIYLKKRDFSNTRNGIAFYSDKNKKVFFDVVQPNRDLISSNLSAGTLSIEFSGSGEKIISNCGASESFGKNPEYLRYSAAHSCVILQNTNISEIKENNPHLKYPQSVVFIKENNHDCQIFEGSHNGYAKKFNKIVKRKLLINKNKIRLDGEDTIITLKNINNRLIYHIRFHLADNISYNFTNNKKNIILKTKLNNIWIFKSETELIVEDSILVDNNITKPTKQIVIKGVTTDKKTTQKWSIEKI